MENPETTKPLPEFKYNPNFIENGDVKKSEATCKSCNKRTGYAYYGPVENLHDGKLKEGEEYVLGEESICPWCISDGSAHEKFGIEFFNHFIDERIGEEILYKTPSFFTYQEPEWLFHCNEPSIYLGPAGKEEVEACGPELIHYLKEKHEMSDEEWKDFIENFHKTGDARFHIFKCPQCSTLIGFSDLS